MRKADLVDEMDLMRMRNRPRPPGRAVQWFARALLRVLGYIAEPVELWLSDENRRSVAEGATIYWCGDRILCASITVTRERGAQPPTTGGADEGDAPPTRTT